MNYSRLAKDVMVTKLVTLTPTTPVFDGIARLLRSRVSGAPVMRERRQYAGVFSESCCLRMLSTSARFAHDRSVAKTLTAGDLMTRNLVTLSPEMDVFEAIGFLLRHKISGAPVVDNKRQLVGIFSEKTCMSVLIEGVYDQMPTSTVSEFMKSDENSTISEDLDLLEIVQLFLDKSYRRLQVLREGKVVGQISPRDALRAAHTMSLSDPNREEVLQTWRQDQWRQDQEANESMELGEDADPSLAELVATFLDADAQTITPDTDLLSIAHIFGGSCYRRLPVVQSGELVGQVSRRDLLRATNDLMKIEPKREKPLLYLSSLLEHGNAPIE